MITIGNYNEEMPMMPQLNDYEVNGYKFADLTAEDKKFIKGIALAMDSLDGYVAHGGTGYTTIDSLVTEIEGNTLYEIRLHLLSLIGEAMFSFIQRYAEIDEYEQMTRPAKGYEQMTRMSKE